MTGQINLVAGVDCSTQGTKVLIVDTGDGRVVASGRAPHEVTGSDGARETDPEQWWDALGSALEETGRAADVGGIAVAGQQHGLVTLDGDGRPLRPAILWNDTRSAPEAQELTEALGGPETWADRIGLVPVPSFTATRWAWLRRHDPEAAAATRAVRLPHDFLTERLCGRGRHRPGRRLGHRLVVHQGRELRHRRAGADRARSRAAARRAGPGRPGRRAVGDGRPGAGTRGGGGVGPGTGDNMGAALGLGLAPGEPVISLGTSGTAYAVMDERAADPSGTVAGFADASGRFLPLAATLNATMAIDRVAEWLGLDRDAPAESTRVVVLPYLDGERTPNLPQAAGMVAGLRHATTREEILLAAYEGAVASLVEALDRIGEQGSGLDPEAPVLLVGGGARGPAWQRTVARLSGRDVQIPEADELVALGAAAQAAACVSGEAPEEVARRWDLRRGTTVAAPAERDAETLERINVTRQASLQLHDPPRD